MSDSGLEDSDLTFGRSLHDPEIAVLCCCLLLLLRTPIFVSVCVGGGFYTGNCVRGYQPGFTPNLSDLKTRNASAQ
jgi:hypothetical protein